MDEMRFVVSDAVDSQIKKLDAIQESHPFWENRLFAASLNGDLSIEDWRYIHSQYYLYSRNFTRYLAAVMANCENDYYRARLSENLWEEGGGIRSQERHAELYRRFLTDVLNIQNIGSIQYSSNSKFFASEYLSRCLHRSPIYSTAFLSMGTEGIVSRMYSIMIKGMTAAGIPSPGLRFFHLHVACDDDHAATLAEMMGSYSDRPGWFEACQTAIDDALSLRLQYFNGLYDALWQDRVRQIADDVAARVSLFSNSAERLEVSSVVPENSSGNVGADEGDAAINVVSNSQVLDQRIIEIPSGNACDDSSSPVEEVIYVIEGELEIEVDKMLFKLKSREYFFVPRWCVRRLSNGGKGDLVLLSITDRKLVNRFTNSAFDVIISHSTDTGAHGVKDLNMRSVA